MKRRIAQARTVSTSIALGPPKVYVRKMRGKHFAQARTVNEAAKRGRHNPPAH